ncbi:MAG: GNAT family N-acetyltransferase [Firmicutes bacterium]|nr:GNAT family N-acetyltransferase [Bacillota bacterium]
MLKEINTNNKVFTSKEFQKDKYKFLLILQNLQSKTLKLYSDEENYVLCRGGVEWPTWIWTIDNFDKSLLTEIEEAIDIYRLDIDTRFTCKKELYDLLVKDNFESLGDYYFEMGYLVCDKTIEPKKCDGYFDKATKEDEEVLTNFIYNESHEISDVKSLSIEEAKKAFEKRLNSGNYYVWKNDNNEIVAQAHYSVVDGNAKVAGVYTIPEGRSKGYAGNTIYQLTNIALENGYHVSLYTDYKYIPSNKAYKNVGYVDKDVLINFSCTRVKSYERR